MHHELYPRRPVCLCGSQAVRKRLPPPEALAIPARTRRGSSSSGQAGAPAVAAARGGAPPQPHITPEEYVSRDEVFKVPPKPDSVDEIQPLRVKTVLPPNQRPCMRQAPGGRTSL